MPYICSSDFECLTLALKFTLLGSKTSICTSIHKNELLMLKCEFYMRLRVKHRYGCLEHKVSTLNHFLDTEDDVKSKGTPERICL